MVTYLCNRCSYQSNHKGNFKNHLNRKNVCEPLLENISIKEVRILYGLITEPKTTQNEPKITQNELTDEPKITQFEPKITQNNPKITQNNPKIHICKFCNKVFNRNWHLSRHLNICKSKKNNELLILQEKNKEIDMLKNKLLSQSNIQNNTTNNINNNINNTININNYGDENLKHLRLNDFTSLFEGIYTAVPKLIQKIHFDPEHPENQNIKYTNQKSPYLRVMKNSKWNLVAKKHELLDLIDNKCFLLKEKYYNILEKKKCYITNIQRKKIEEFIDKYHEEDKKVMIDLIERTELMLLNHS